LADANESGDIRIPLKIKLSAFWLMDVPENVGGNGVKPHGLGHANTGSPKFVGNPRKMDFSGQNLKWMSVQKELATRDLKRVRWTKCERRHAHGWQGNATDSGND
jgi:hypothetical protein